MRRCWLGGPRAAHRRSFGRVLYQTHLSHSGSSILVAFDMTLLEGRVGGTSVYANALRGALSERDDVVVEVVSAPAGGGLNTVKWMLSGARASVRRIGAAVLHCPAFLAPL